MNYMFGERTALSQNTTSSDSTTISQTIHTNRDTVKKASKRCDEISVSMKALHLSFYSLPSAPLTASRYNLCNKSKLYSYNINSLVAQFIQHKFSRGSIKLRASSINRMREGRTNEIKGFSLI